MTNQGKTTLSLSTLALLGLTMTCDAYADADSRNERRTMKQVRSCVSEIAKYANYDDASRALHLVERLKQKNLIELEIRIETSVYAAADEPAARKYKTSCLVAGLGNLVDFRIDEMELIRATESQEF
mgnify:FL=1|jgi:hypothetical protein